MTRQEKFFEQFKFDSSKVGFVGVEREQFVIDPQTATIIPRADMYLKYTHDLEGSFDNRLLAFGYELSACQLESKIGPCRIFDLKGRLLDGEHFLRECDTILGMARINCELAPEDMPLDIYPDPTGRYQVITRNMPKMILSAACRVAATHVHVGMPDLQTAVAVYNRAVEHIEELIKLGDGSSGKRIGLYRIMAPRHIPFPISSPQEFFQRAEEHGFANDPRSCWTLIRISIHGTIEFRMFGATDSIDQIVGWASRCRELCV